MTFVNSSTICDMSLNSNETLGRDQKYGIAHLMLGGWRSDLDRLSPVSPPSTTKKEGTDHMIDFMLESTNISENRFGKLVSIWQMMMVSSQSIVDSLLMSTFTISWVFQTSNGRMGPDRIHRSFVPLQALTCRLDFKFVDAIT